MRIRPPTGSQFRPAWPLDPGTLAENKSLIERIDRRNVLRGTLSLGALTLLGGCDVTDTDSMQKVLTAVSAYNLVRAVMALAARRHHLSPRYHQYLSSRRPPLSFLSSG